MPERTPLGDNNQRIKHNHHMEPKSAKQYLLFFFVQVIWHSLICISQTLSPKKELEQAHPFVRSFASIYWPRRNKEEEKKGEYKNTTRICTHRNPSSGGLGGVQKEKGREKKVNSMFPKPAKVAQSIKISNYNANPGIMLLLSIRT